MRATVALVRAHPDTIAEDYTRLLDLAGCDGSAAGALLVDAAGRPEAGWGATPWQFEQVLARCAGAGGRPRVVGVGPRGLRPAPLARPWEELREASGLPAAEAGFLRPHRPTSSTPHPALDAALASGVTLPVGLAGKESWILTSPTLRPGWGLAGACRAARDVVLAGARPRRGAPAAELTIEAVRLLREQCHTVGAVLDGTFWGVARGFAHRSRAVRNVLLAGRDPVAVDAVAARLAGLDPLRVPWLRLCRERGCGRVGPDEIRVVGAVELLDLDFDLPADTFAAGRETPPPGLGGAWGRLVDRALGRGGIRGWSGTPWADLVPGDAGRS
ncbi:hypothetical protein KDM41_12195 [bacterium]|nr:hypothetical protein [bacterium]